MGGAPVLWALSTITMPLGKDIGSQINKPIFRIQLFHFLVYFIHNFSRKLSIIMEDTFFHIVNGKSSPL